jgi:hypothetical protein
VEGAVHGLELVLLLLDLHLVVHVFTVKVKVPARLPQVDLGDVRRVHELVAACQVDVLPVGLDHVAHDRAVGVPKHEAAAGALLLDGEQVELSAELAVVAPRRLLAQVLVRGQLLGGRPRGAIHALQHRPRLVAAPVRAGHRQQLDRVGVDRAGRRHVRPRAQVPPVRRVVGRADVVHGDRCIRVARADRLQNLELVRLVGGLDARLGLFGRDLLLDKRQVHADDLGHLLLDALEVLVAERLLEVKVVVKAVLDPRADRHLRVLVQPLHGHRHDVRALAFFLAGGGWGCGAEEAEIF